MSILTPIPVCCTKLKIVNEFVFSDCGTHLQVSLSGMLHVLHGAAMDFLQTLLPPLMLCLQLVQLHPQMLPLLAELVLQLLQGRLRLRQLHLQALLQQGYLRSNRGKNKDSSD